ncbi:hypothetical protein ACHMW6_19205 [Pseudoduganella sp. UC29_106]|uniref:hypothetical protein n=1 Tax=Pseudoduganella sp. UC29_106 TaxID=3374553 RepID=UPI003757ED7B
MGAPIRVLLQTTIETAANDWHIGRFSMLRDFLASQRGSDGAPLFEVTARDRAAVGQPDPVISTLGSSDYDEVWLFAVDTGNGLHAEDCAGLSAFHRKGGGMMVTRDHMDLGCSLCSIAGIGALHLFHTRDGVTGDPRCAPGRPRHAADPLAQFPLRRKRRRAARHHQRRHPSGAARS